MEAELATGVKKHMGSCHCGAVKFAVDVDLSKGATRCNCSICTKTAILSAIVKPDAFELLTSEEASFGYEWGSKIGKRFFCKTCGMHWGGNGHLAEVGGDYVSVNVNCLDDVEISAVGVMYWDGRHDNWQAGPRSTPYPIFTEERAEG